MKYVKNSYLPLVVGGIVLLGLGLLIGLNVNKKEVYTKRDIVASNTEVNDNNNIEVVGEEIELKEDKTEIEDSSSTNKIPDNTVTNNVINNTEKLPQTGLTEDITIMFFIVLCVASAVFAYVKIRRYNDR